MSVHAEHGAAPTGLTAAEVQERVADGRVNLVPRAPTRTTWQIVRANVFTPVNAIISIMAVFVVIAAGIGPDLLFSGVVISNSVIGVVQEIRARAALDRLAVLTAPTAYVRRDGETVSLEVDQVVADDILVLEPGDQVVVDGDVLTSQGLELNESLLTGEADSVSKAAGDEVLSGSFVAAGSGYYAATRIGAESYAASLAEEARAFSMANSELRNGVNKVLRALMFIIPPLAVILYLRMNHEQGNWRDALVDTVSGTVAMVPDGLVLLTSLAFMAGVVTLARRGALLRELASVELLARVNTICLDKTGTITTGEIKFADVEMLQEADPEQFADVLGAISHSDPNPNPTLAAIASAFEAVPDWEIEDIIPFSSARKFSAACFSRDIPGAPAGHRAVYLGAPEILLGGKHPEVAERVAVHAGAGYRLVMISTATEMTGDELPASLLPAALVILEDELRENVNEILEYFVTQDINLVVISGDHPETVAAVAQRAGVPESETAIDARELPEEREDLVDILRENNVYGRVTPRQKREMVETMQEYGHVVAMTGDGVNDVLALKNADMGIAMGAGSEASRAVAQLVLIDNQFSILPKVLAEGRRVINSVERAANLFLTGTVYSLMFVVVVSIIGVEFPFLPRHLTIVRVITVGLPGFFLALAPDSRRARDGFLERVLSFSIRAGLIAGVSTLAVYFYARSVDGTTLIEQRTAATMTLMGAGLLILFRLTSMLPPWRWALMVCAAAAAILAFTLPLTKDVFELVIPPSSVLTAVAVGILVVAVGLFLVSVASDEDDEHSTGSSDTTVRTVAKSDV